MSKLRLITCGVLLIAVAMLASGCKRELDQPLLEGLVEGYYRDTVRIDVDARCPAKVEMRTANDFLCTFTYGSLKREGSILVIQHDQYGRIALVPADPVNHERVQRLAKAWLLRFHDLDRAVTCPDDVVPLAGHNFSCTAGDRTIRVHQVSSNYDFDFLLVGSDSDRGNG